MATTTASVSDLCLAAQAAARELAVLPTTVKDAALHAIAGALVARTPEILEANARDMEAGGEAGLSAALLDRLRLDEDRIAAIAGQTRAIAALEDPVGEVIAGRRLPNGLDLTQVRVPLGVVAVVYEARPNVTIDAPACCLKSGNAWSCAARRAPRTPTPSWPGSPATRPRRRAARGRGAPRGGGGREELAELATQDGVVDLIIPRGGEGLKARCRPWPPCPSSTPRRATATSTSTPRRTWLGRGDRGQRQGPAARRVQRARRCSSTRTSRRLPAAASWAPAAEGVELRVDGRAHAAAGADLAPELVDAEADDWDTEFLALTLAVGVVDSVEEAIAHVNAHGSGHSEAIVTGDAAAARAFERGVDAACVYVNASTRFTDGGEFGMGAEIGNSTQKLHARGPIGMRELCTTKYVVRGDGHVRP
jgi:glutamate-5-semialdehyde dehydrogenase